MPKRYETIQIKEVGPTSNPLCNEVGRGVFNFDSFLDYLSHSDDGTSKDIIIDLSQVGWVTLFDWWNFTCILHGQAERDPDLRIHLDFVGEKDLIPYNECADFIKGRSSPRFPENHYLDSSCVHRVLNFVKTLEPGSFENVARGQITLFRLTSEEARRPGWYRNDPEVENSVILPRVHAEAKEICLQFADRNHIKRWQEAMVSKRVPNAAIFQSEEFWRVLCHELARNVVEHAGGPGFISGRVVLPIEGKLPLWCRDVYDEFVLRQLEHAREHGFVELCISDAGVGIPETIETSYRKRYQERHREELKPKSIQHENLIKFAFDELGTSKDADSSWITDRHALGHMLFITEKYGGILSVRSKDAAITYSAEENKFKRCDNQLGFEPQHSRQVNPTIPGTHIQILIPLTPGKISYTSAQPASSLPLPQSFHVDYQHPVGPLLPLRDKLGVFSECIDGTEIYKFKEACRALARELLRGSHPRNQILVFDFSEVDWPPNQFETFLYLMQNVLINRLVIFTQMPREFAKLVNSQEDEDRPTYLSDYIRNRELEREFSDGRFLETYSALGALVLALGPDQGEYLFGVRNKSLRVALLELINDERQTIQGLCDAHDLDTHQLSAVLHRASHLFKLDKFERWGSAFVRGAPDRDDLEVQRLRAITAHFDRVADNCKAWRGASSESGELPERFYLPSEDAVYKKFLQTSRILSRERYAIEVAERLLYRMSYGLSTLFNQELSLDDIDILACSTTPTVMLAEAIRRVWPFDLVGKKRPVVIDYGPSLFSGANPAHILNAKGKNLRAIVIQDLFDEGKLTKRLVTLAEKQGLEVLFVMSLVRFLKPIDCAEIKSKPFSPTDNWDEVNPLVDKPVHALIGVSRPDKVPRPDVQDWGVAEHNRDYVVDPRSLRPVPLPSLRLESGYSDERSLTKRDPYLKEFDSDNGVCRLAAGHFVYGHRHFAVVVDIRGILERGIGHKIITWLADLCCGNNQNLPWEAKRREALDGEVTAILLPLHSQIHYLLPGLQVELAQRGIRVPYFFLDSTSFGGGVETYDIPTQLQFQIQEAANEIKRVMDSQGTEEEKEKKIKDKQLRLLLLDDAIFSGQTIRTVLDSLAKRIDLIRDEKYSEPIEWIRAFAVLNQMPTARSALWHQLNSCSASSKFRFDEYAPFVGVATYSAADCPACKRLEQLEYHIRRINDVGHTAAADWIRDHQEVLTPKNMESPSFNEPPSPELPLPIDVLALRGEGAPDRYKPIHADSAIWRFYELMYLSYPLGDVLHCLKEVRQVGLDNLDFRDEYARFRLAIYDWCIQNWHQVRLYHTEEQMLQELKAEVEEGELIYIDVIYQLHRLIQDDYVIKFVRWIINCLAEKDAYSTRAATETTLNLDTALTLLFLSLTQVELDETGLLDYLSAKQASMPRKSSFLSLLYLRLTRPRMADPYWALTTIAEICFRGFFGDTLEVRRTVDHELLGSRP